MTLKIAETNPKFVGRGVALLDPKVMDPILYTRNNIGLGIDDKITVQKAQM